MTDAPYFPVDGSGVIPTATPITNPISGSGLITAYKYPTGKVAFAAKITGEAFPRWLWIPDDALYLGDGTIDPFAHGVGVWMNNAGTLIVGSGSNPGIAIEAHGDVRFTRADTGPILLAPNATKHRLIVSNAGTVTSEVVA